VHLIFLLDTAQTIFTMVDGFFWFGDHYGDMTTLVESRFGGIDTAACDAAIALLVQFVYCWRIWKLSQWKITPVLTASVSPWQPSAINAQQVKP
jgi:hypothetical protein